MPLKKAHEQLGSWQSTPRGQFLSLGWLGAHRNRRPSVSRSRDVILRVAVVLALLALDTAESADCRAEVEAAFQKLQIRSRPYRRATTIASSVHVPDPRGV